MKHPFFIVFVALFAVVFSFSPLMFAEGKAAWGKDHRLIAQWFTDNANARKFIDWAEDNLSQEQVDGLESLMFPPLPEGSKSSLMDMIKVQLQQANYEKSADPEEKAVYEAVLTALDQKAEAAAVSEATPEPTK